MVSTLAAGGVLLFGATLGSRSRRFDLAPFLALLVALVSVALVAVALVVQLGQVVPGADRCPVPCRRQLIRCPLILVVSDPAAWSALIHPLSRRGVYAGRWRCSSLWLNPR